MFDSLLTIAFPQACQVCGKITEKFADGAACAACWTGTRIFAGGETLCAKCSEYLRFGPSDQSPLCHLCDTHSYDAARSVGPYEKALAASVIALKSTPFVASRLRRLMSEAFERSPFYDSDLVVPVPLSRKRFHERGFNQAELLARSIASGAGLALDRASLVRTRHTPMHRAAMDRRSREATVEKAFEVTRGKLIERKRILLVDDVFTSGATASKCAEVLKQNGARRVYVLTVARAV